MSKFKRELYDNEEKIRKFNRTITSYNEKNGEITIYYDDGTSEKFVISPNNENYSITKRNIEDYLEKKKKTMMKENKASILYTIVCAAIGIAEFYMFIKHPDLVLVGTIPAIPIFICGYNWYEKTKEQIEEDKKAQHIIITQLSEMDKNRTNAMQYIQTRKSFSLTEKEYPVDMKTQNKVVRIKK